MCLPTFGAQAGLMKNDSLFGSFSVGFGGQYFTHFGVSKVDPKPEGTVDGGNPPPSAAYVRKGTQGGTLNASKIIGN